AWWTQLAIKLIDGGIDRKGITVERRADGVPRADQTSSRGSIVPVHRRRAACYKHGLLSVLTDQRRNTGWRTSGFPAFQHRLQSIASAHLLTGRFGLQNNQVRAGRH